MNQEKLKRIVVEILEQDKISYDELKSISFEKEHFESVSHHGKFISNNPKINVEYVSNERLQKYKKELENFNSLSFFKKLKTQMPLDDRAENGNYLYKIETSRILSYLMDKI